MQIVEKEFTTKEHGIAGFLSHPERRTPGPALLLIHPKGGMTDYIKIESRKYARLGYSTLPLTYSSNSATRRQPTSKPDRRFKLRPQIPNSPGCSPKAGAFCYPSRM